MTRELWKGNEAIAEASVRAGLEAYFGYPITPQTEILEYVSRRMRELGKRQQAHIVKGFVTDDGLLRHPAHVRRAFGDFLMRRRASEIGLAGRSVIERAHANYCALKRPG